jgi:HEAT repeat protein
MHSSNKRAQMNAKHHLILTFTVWVGFCCAPVGGATPAYDLKTVKGIEAFEGSAEARETLAKIGFVVADPAFKQIFEPYIESPEVEESSPSHPMGESLPSIITTDSAWHTYHVLLEEGVKDMEEVQSQKLLRFSQRLWKAAQEQESNSNGADLSLFASIGLALQSEQHRRDLSGEAKQIVEGLRAGTAPVKVPIGFELAPALLRAQSFYAGAPELSDYFAARQWYATVVFRLSKDRETRAAVALAYMVNGDSELRQLWNELSDPFDTFVAPAEDGTVGHYLAATTAVVGPQLPSSGLSADQLAQIQKWLWQKLPPPRVNDQLLAPSQYTQFGKDIRGFRLLPPRQLPCAVCFHDTVNPRIPNRQYPSGLDFLAASTVLRSPAAVRAVENQFGKRVSELILKSDCGPMPSSLHGEAMHLLASLQKPLPVQAPASMRNDAWQDLQLWTQLAAWAEQRHTWALHTKLSVCFMGGINPPKGMVAPYPEFFAGLAKMSRKTAAAFESAGLQPPFEVRTAASDLLEILTLSEQGSTIHFDEQYEKMSTRLRQLGEFQNLYYEQHKTELENGRSGEAWKNLHERLKSLAQSSVASGKATEAEAATLRSFYDCRQIVGRYLQEFAPVCDRLSVLAGKSLNGQAVTEEEAKWIRGYGVTLAKFHFYDGNSYEAPRDDFPIVTRVFSNPLTSSTLYAGLARPQALYVIAPVNGTNQLYRGAVMSYREFVRPNDQLLDDKSWREMVEKGQTPPAPPFTTSFFAETSVSELLKKLRALGQSEEPDYSDVKDILWQLSSRVKDKDLPALLNEMDRTKETSSEDVMEGLTEIIAKMSWEPHQDRLVEMLASMRSRLAFSAAQILIQRPTAVKTANLIAGFPHQSPQVRRVYCAILSRVPRPTGAIRATFLKGMEDSSAGVRWQAVMAVGQSLWNDERSRAALLGMVDDSNPFVGCAATYSLSRLGATNAAPALFTKLQAVLAATNTHAKLLEESQEITKDFHNLGSRGSDVIDPDHQQSRLYQGVEESANGEDATPRRLPPGLSAHRSNYDLATALIEALGALRYTPAADELFKLRNTRYDFAATRALSSIAPGRLATELLGIAKDTTIDSYLREKAIATLCNLTMTNCVRDLIPLLDDVTPIIYSRPSPGLEWRICDRAAVSIAVLLDWENAYITWLPRPGKTEALIKRAREWANQAR